jgi:hypothetical protein
MRFARWHSRLCNEVTEWLAWFAGIAIEAQLRTTAQVECLIDKTRLLDRLSSELNARQKKVILRMMEEGPEGFKCGLSAGNYSKIADSSPATTTRDLADLVKQGALIRTGVRKHTRYALNLPLRPIPQIMIDEKGKIVESAGSTSPPVPVMASSTSIGSSCHPQRICRIRDGGWSSDSFAPDRSTP